MTRATVVVIFLCLPILCWANSLQGRSISIAVGPRSENTSAEIDRIVEDAASVYVRWLGMNVTLADGAQPVQNPSRRDLSGIAGGDSFALFALWSVADTPGSAIDVNLTLYERSSTRPLARRTGTVRLHVSPERDVVELLQELFDDAVAVLVETSSDLLDWGIDDPSPGRSAVAAAAVQKVPRIFELGGGYAPAFAAGEAARLYGFGHGAAAYGGIVIGRRSAVVTGLSGSVLVTHAEGVAASGELLMVPVAATIRFRSTPAPIGAYLSFGLGAAFLRFENPILGSFSKIAPYAGAGVGLTFALAAWTGLNLGVSMNAVLDGDTVLTEFAPSILAYAGF